MIEEGKWLLAVTSFEATKSVSNIINENSSFLISIPGFWRIHNYLKDGNIEKLKNLLKHRSQNDVESHVEEVRKRGNK